MKKDNVIPLEKLDLLTGLLRSGARELILARDTFGWLGALPEPG
jgi:hypothetical protein|tara:strand:- start:300 stop:431 length:132 start_codon:yes stop_codon:yes gene_type:complete